MHLSVQKRQLRLRPLNTNTYVSPGFVSFPGSILLIMANLTTLLDAVNICIMTSGEQPVNSLDETRADIQIAKKIIEDTSLDVQAQGWRFNEEYDAPLTTNSSNEIPLANNTIRVEITSGPSDINAVIRGSKLYDTKNRTYKFPSTTQLKATVTYALNFDELPQAARKYIAAKAARIFTDRFVGDNALAQYARDEENRLLVILQRHETQTGDYNYLDGDRYKQYLANKYRDKN